MNEIVEAAQVIQTPDAKGWSSVHQFDDTESGGRVVVLITATFLETGPRKTSVEVIQQGRDYLALLHGRFSEKGTVSSRLEQALSEVPSRTKHESIGIVAVVVTPQKVVSAARNGSVLLSRKGKIAKIVSSEDAFVMQVGRPESNDVFILVSNHFVLDVHPSVVHSAVARDSVKETSLHLSQHLETLQSDGRRAAAIIKLTETFVSPIVVSSPQQALKEKNPHEEGVPFTPRTSEALSQPLLSGVRTVLVKSIDSAIAGLSKLQKVPSEISVGTVVRSDTVDLGTHTKKRIAIMVGVLLVILLSVSVAFGLHAKQVREENEIFAEKKSHVETLLAEAQSLYDLNPVKARELILEAQQQSLVLKDTYPKRAEVAALVDRISSQTGSIAGIYDVGPEKYLDLALATPEFVGSELSLSDGTLLVLSKDTDQLIEVEVDTKRTEVRAGPDDIREATDISAYTDEAYAVVNGSIFEVDVETRLVIGDEWGGDILIHSFAGNLYVLDTDEEKIWRYPRVSSGYGGRSDWLAEGMEPPLKDTVSWAIDGNIWTLDKTGRVRVFSHGVQQTYSFSGFEGELGGVRDIYVDEDTQDIYLLDAINQRILVFEKETGSFRAEYDHVILGDATRVAVSEQDQRILVLVGSTLYSISLEHL